MRIKLPFIKSWLTFFADLPETLKRGCDALYGRFEPLQETSTRKGLAMRVTFGLLSVGSVMHRDPRSSW